MKLGVKCNVNQVPQQIAMHVVLTKVLWIFKYSDIRRRMDRYIFTDFSKMVAASISSCPEDGDSKFLRKLGNYPVYKASYLRIIGSSA